MATIFVPGVCLHSSWGYGSRYSTQIVRLTGSNVVPVLATSFLLSYEKFILHWLTEGTPFLVWLQAGNTPFRHGAHILPFTLLAALLYVIPLTLLVILAPYLHASQVRCQRTALGNQIEATIGCLPMSGTFHLKHFPKSPCTTQPCFKFSFC